MKTIRLKRERQPSGLMFVEVSEGGDVVIEVPKGKEGKVKLIGEDIEFGFEEFRQLSVWVTSGHTPLTGKEASKTKEWKEVQRRDEEIAKLKTQLTRKAEEIAGLKGGK